MSNVQDFAEKIITNIEKVIIGKRDTVELAVIGLLCQGHLLIEDVPGVGKTMLARSLARSLGCSFSRIQFTPDMLPTPHEISLVKQTCGPAFLVVTPGIRPSWLPPDDQKRSATPQEALREGADYIVMGRGILKQDDPIKALELISLEMLTA